MRKLAFLVLMTVLISLGIAWAKEPKAPAQKERETQVTKDKDNLQKATFAGGCFWCTEAVFQQLKGVYKVTSGYTGGQTQNPSYEQICSGDTGHAEAIEISYDPKEITFAELLEVHFKTHDPTSLNRQGNDVGTQYRSSVFYHTPEQKAATEEIISELNAQKVYNDPIVTEVVPESVFYAAEDYHQDYYSNNPRQGYCAMVITPKVEKFRKIFADKIREDSVAK